MLKVETIFWCCLHTWQLIYEFIGGKPLAVITQIIYAFVFNTLLKIENIFLLVRFDNNNRQKKKWANFRHIIRIFNLISFASFGFQKFHYMFYTLIWWNFLRLCPFFSICWKQVEKYWLDSIQFRSHFILWSNETK